MLTTVATAPARTPTQRLLAPPASCPHLLDVTGTQAVLDRSFNALTSAPEIASCLYNWHRLYELEQRLFPDVPSQLIQLAASAFEHEALLVQIDAFLERVCSQHFPVIEDASWSIYVEPHVAWVLDAIPVMPQGVSYVHPDDTCCTGVFMGAGATDLLMCLAARENWMMADFSSAISSSAIATYPYLNALPPDFTLSRIVPSLEQQPPPSPYSDIAAACQYVLQETGNLWLDICYDDYHENYSAESWDNVAAVTRLRDAWQAARPIVEACDRLEAWCDESREVNLRKLVRLLADRWQMVTGQLVMAFVGDGWD